MLAYASSLSAIPRASVSVKPCRRIAARPLRASCPVARALSTAVTTRPAQPLARKRGGRVQPLCAAADAGGNGPDITQANEVANQDALIDQMLAARNDDEFARLVAEK
jgi:hypothetical protein